jgi:hypothetical protein
MLAPASWKVTVPVGAGATGVMVAVKVTDWPQTEGFVADVRVVVDIESAWPTMLPENSDSAPAVNPAATLPFMTLDPAQSTCGAVDVS